MSWPETTSKQRSMPRSVAHFQGKLFARLLGIAHTKPYIKFEVYSSSSFTDMFDRMPKLVGITWPRPRPLSGKLFVRPLGIPDTKLHTKFEVSSSSSFEILRSKLIGVTSLTIQGHVTLSVMWPFDSPYAIFYWQSFGTNPLSVMVSDIFNV